MKKRYQGGVFQITALLENAFKELGLRSDYENLRLELLCREVLGTKFKSVLNKVRLRKETVYLEFNHSIWTNEIQFYRVGLLKRLQEEFPKLKIKDLIIGLSK